MMAMELQPLSCMLGNNNCEKDIHTLEQKHDKTRIQVPSLHLLPGKPCNFFMVFGEKSG